MCNAVHTCVGVCSFLLQRWGRGCLSNVVDRSVAPAAVGLLPSNPCRPPSSCSAEAATASNDVELVYCKLLLLNQKLCCPSSACSAEAATASNDVELVYYKLLHLSSHYNTQVGGGEVRGLRSCHAEEAAARWLKDGARLLRQGLPGLVCCQPPTAPQPPLVPQLGLRGVCRCQLPLCP